MFICFSRLLGLFLVVLGTAILFAYLFPTWLLMVIEGFIIVLIGLLLLRC